MTGAPCRDGLGAPEGAEPCGLGASPAIPSADDPWLWYWGYGSEPEVYQGGEDTREAILQVARLESDGETFTIIEARRGGFRFDVFDSDRVLDDFAEHNDECWGEDGAEFKCPPGSKRQLEQALTTAFETWFSEHAPTRRFAFEHMRNEETFLSAEYGEDELASAIEARRAATGNTDAVHESAAPQEDAR